jgi:hypothetical protein
MRRFGLIRNCGQRSMFRAQIFRSQGKNEQTDSELMTLRFLAMQLVATMFARTAQIRWKRARR